MPHQILFIEAVRVFPPSPEVLGCFFLTQRSTQLRQRYIWSWRIRSRGKPRFPYLTSSRVSGLPPSQSEPLEIMLPFGGRQNLESTTHFVARFCREQLKRRCASSSPTIHQIQSSRSSLTVRPTTRAGSRLSLIEKLCTRETVSSANSSVSRFRG